jgi:hypothetical protein
MDSERPKPNKNIPVATNSEIFEEHLRYELNMLVGTFLLLEGSTKVTDNEGRDVAEKVITNALIESFCVHARSLNDFFSGKPQKSDARPTDYTKVTYKRPERDDGWRDLIDKVNKQIAHLTKLRTKDEAEKVGTDDRRKLVETLMTDLRNFVEDLKPEFDAATLALYRAPEMREPTPGNKVTTSIHVQISPSVFRGQE